MLREKDDMDAWMAVKPNMTGLAENVAEGNGVTC